MKTSSNPHRTKIVHVVYSFAIGGLENVIVQLINQLPEDEYEHTVLSLSTISDFRSRIKRTDVQFIALNKSPGHAVPLYPKIWRLLRQLRPDVMHSCNLAALEVAPLAWLAGVRRRVHAEHGWDAHDPHGLNPRYQRLRRLYKPFVSHYVAVSRDIDDYLARVIHIPQSRRSLIANGVDTETFAPGVGSLPDVPGCPFKPGHHWLIGTVGRFQTVKNQPFLARAFVEMLNSHPEASSRVRLVMVGEGPLRQEVERILEQAGMSHLAWLPGARNDVAAILQCLDCFALPSYTEGTSCTLQEAMSSGLPTVATAVGGTPELIVEGVTGQLVAPDDDSGLANALWMAMSNPEMAHRQGLAARQLALNSFSLGTMISRYHALFRAAG